MQLVFWDPKIININKWIDEYYKKLKNIKYLSSVINEDWQKVIINDVQLLKDWLKRMDKYNKSLTQIQINNMLDRVIEPILKRTTEYYEKHYDHVVQWKREQYKKDMQKKLKTQREIICPF